MDDRCDTLCMVYPMSNAGLLPAELTTVQSPHLVGLFDGAVPMPCPAWSPDTPCCSRHWRGRPEGGPL